MLPTDGLWGFAKDEFPGVHPDDAPLEVSAGSLSLAGNVLSFGKTFGASFWFDGTGVCWKNVGARDIPLWWREVFKMADADDMYFYLLVHGDMSEKYWAIELPVEIGAGRAVNYGIRLN